MQTSPSRTTTLTTTQAAVLGLLTFGERSGYELRKLAERSVGFFWAPAKSQIYAVLPRLVELGLATRRDVRQEQRPDKQLYEITDAGEDALRLWLAETELRPEPCPNPFLLKLFFAAYMEHDEVVALVEEHRRRAQEHLSRLRQIERGAGGEEDYYPLLTLRSGKAHAGAAMKWADEVLAELRR